MGDSIRRWCVASALAIVAASGAARADAAAWFATECQEAFQNHYVPTLKYTYARCSTFNKELNDTDLHWYYYNLVGAKYRWEIYQDELFMDDVDLLYAATHGGAWNVDGKHLSVWSMWDDETAADSTWMRLGDEANGLSLFATYACETLKTIDGNHWKRMGPIFRGGLRVAMGSHDKVYSGYTTDDMGEDFADGLQKGKSLKYAWKDGNTDWYVDQDLTVMTTGWDAGDCHNRRAYMTWQNYPYYPRWRDGQIGWRCWSKWDDI